LSSTRKANHLLEFTFLFSQIFSWLRACKYSFVLKKETFVSRKSEVLKSNSNHDPGPVQSYSYYFPRAKFLGFLALKIFGETCLKLKNKFVGSGFLQNWYIYRAACDSSGVKSNELYV